MNFQKKIYVKYLILYAEKFVLKIMNFFLFTSLVINRSKEVI